MQSPPALEQDSLRDSRAQGERVASLTLPDEAEETRGYLSVQQPLNLSLLTLLPLRSTVHSSKHVSPDKGKRVHQSGQVGWVKEAKIACPAGR